MNSEFEYVLNSELKLNSEFEYVVNADVNDDQICSKIESFEIILNYSEFEYVFHP